SLSRHGYHSAIVPGRIRALRVVARFFIELVARYVVVSHLRRVSTDLRNLYWLREMQTEPLTEERRTIRRARLDAEGLMVVMQRRAFGLPSFVIGGLLLPLLASTGRLSGVALGTWWETTIAAVVAGLVVIFASWV